MSSGLRLCSPGMSDASGEVTRLLDALRGGRGSLSDLAPLVYDELRAIARSRMRRERDGHTLSATALVNEAWMRLDQNRELSAQNRGQFLAAASEAMRRVLVDHARKVKSERRGGDRARMTITLDECAVGDDPDRMLALDEALATLDAADARAAHVARLRLFSGLGPEEVADVLGTSVRSVGRDWTYARAHLTEFLTGRDSRDGARRDIGVDGS